MDVNLCPPCVLLLFGRALVYLVFFLLSACCVRVVVLACLVSGLALVRVSFRCTLTANSLGCFYWFVVF